MEWRLPLAAVLGLALPSQDVQAVGVMHFPWPATEAQRTAPVGAAYYAMSAPLPGMDGKPVDGERREPDGSVRVWSDRGTAHGMAFFQIMEHSVTPVGMVVFFPALSCVRKVEIRDRKGALILSYRYPKVRPAPTNIRRIDDRTFQVSPGPALGFCSHNGGKDWECAPPPSEPTRTGIFTFGEEATAPGFRFMATTSSGMEASGAAWPAGCRVVLADAPRGGGRARHRPGGARSTGP